MTDNGLQVTYMEIVQSSMVEMDVYPLPISAKSRMEPHTSSSFILISLFIGFCMFIYKQPQVVLSSMFDRCE